VSASAADKGTTAVEYMHAMSDLHALFLAEDAIVFTLRMKAASVKLVEKAAAHDSWRIHRDILCPPPQRLSSRVNRGKILIQQTSQVSGGKTGIRPRWSTPT